MDRDVILAAAPQVKTAAQDGVRKFVDMIMTNSALVTLLQVLGGMFIVVCVALLVLRKFWPQTRIGQAMNDGGSKVVWCVAGVLLGVIFIDPKDVLPFLAGVAGTLIQVPLDVLANIFGL